MSTKLISASLVALRRHACQWTPAPPLDLALIDELFAADSVVRFGAPDDASGREKASQVALSDQKAFPKSMDSKHDNVVANGNLVRSIGS
jgi:hypothetical protein